MNFELGDFVSVIDEDLSGVIKEIRGNMVVIETTDDQFLLEYRSDELVKISTDSALNRETFSHASAKRVVEEKELPLKRKQAKLKTKQRFEPVMEVDLHIEKLVRSFADMSHFDILNLQLDTAKRQLDFAISKRFQRIVFIHGVGEGILKEELKYLLRRYDNIKFYDANYQKYGLGATEVYICQNGNCN